MRRLKLEAKSSTGEEITQDDGTDNSDEDKSQVLMILQMVAKSIRSREARRDLGRQQRVRTKRSYCLTRKVGKG